LQLAPVTKILHLLRPHSTGLSCTSNEILQFSALAQSVATKSCICIFCPLRFQVTVEKIADTVPRAERRLRLDLASIGEQKHLFFAMFRTRNIEMDPQCFQDVNNKNKYLKQSFLAYYFL
jgi:hypothetical protein